MLKLAHKGLFIVLLPVAFELVFVWQIHDLLDDIDVQIAKEAHSAQMLLASDNLLSHVLRANVAAISFYCLKDPKYEAVHERMVSELHHDFDVMEKLANHDPKLLKDLNKIAFAQGYGTQLRRLFMNSSEEQHISALFGGFSKLLAKGDPHKDPWTIYLIEQNGRVEGAAIANEKAIGEMLYKWLVGGVIVSIALTLLAGVFFYRDIYVRLQQIIQNIDRIVRKQPLAPPSTGKDEISELDRAIYSTEQSIRELEKFRTESAKLLAAELDAPLHTASTSIESLTANGFDEITQTGRDRLESAKTLVGRLQVLVSDLLAVERITEARLELQMENCILQEIIDNAVESTRGIAQAKGITINAARSADEVECDSKRITQVLVNLLSNAIKFSDDGAEVEVQVRASAHHVEVRVIDHGRGIDPAFQSKIFHRFEQAAESDQNKGSGLGLSICRELVEAHGGQMDFESEKGRTEFRVRLPRVAAIRPEESVSRSSAGPRHSGLWKRSVMLLLAPLVVQLAIVATLFFLVDRADRQAESVRRARHIASQCTELTEHLMMAANYALLYNVEQEQALKDRFYAELPFLEVNLSELNSLVKNDPAQKARIKTMDVTIKKWMQSSQQILNSKERNVSLRDWMQRYPELSSLTDDSSDMGGAVHSLIVNADKEQTDQVANNAAGRRNILMVLLAGLALSIAASIALAVGFARGICGRINKIVVNSRKLVANEPLMEPDSQHNDEIANVDKEFYAAARHLRELDRFKQELLSVTSHELRTPLTGLLATFDMASTGLYGTVNNIGEDTLAHARSTAIELIALITNFLDVEKMRAGKLLISGEQISAAELMAWLTEQVRCKETLCTPDAEGITVLADKERLVQALSSIVDNSSQVVIDVKDGKFAIRVDQAALHSGNPLKNRVTASLCDLIARQHGGASEITDNRVALILHSFTK